ncbi:uncharacterized protein PS065_008632 [Dugong dugon]
MLTRLLAPHLQGNRPRRKKALMGRECAEAYCACALYPSCSQTRSRPRLNPAFCADPAADTPRGVAQGGRPSARACALQSQTVRGACGPVSAADWGSELRSSRASRLRSGRPGRPAREGPGRRGGVRASPGAPLAAGRPPFVSSGARGRRGAAGTGLRPAEGGEDGPVQAPRPSRWGRDYPGVQSSRDTAISQESQEEERMAVGLLKSMYQVSLLPPLPSFSLFSTQQPE